MKLLILITLCAAFALGFTSGASAQSNTAISLSATQMTMTELASALSQRSGQLVLADPSLKAVFGGNFSQSTLEDILTTVTKASGLEWYMLSVPADATADQIQKQAAGQIALLKQVKAEAPVLIFDPVTKTQISFSRTPMAPDAQTTPAASQKHVYYITGVSSATAEAVKDTTPPAAQPAAYADLGRRQREEFLAMSPEQRAQAIEASLQQDLAMGTQRMQEMAIARAQAYRQLRETNPAAYDAWRDTQRNMWRGLREQGVFGDRDGRDRGRGDNSGRR